MKSKGYPLIAGSFFALTAVLLGAFGAHALKEVLNPEQLNSFETGVRYQMYHAFLLILVSFKSGEHVIRMQRWITLLTIFGVVLFSGSIYLLNMQHILGLGLNWLGPVTPVGGLLLISAWTLLFIDAIRPIMPKKN